MGIQIAPPLPFVPADRVGKPVPLLVSCHSGPAAEGERTVDGLREVAQPVAEHVGPMPYPALNSTFDPLLPPGLRHHWRTAFTAELTDGVIAAHVEHGSRTPTVTSLMHA